MVGLFWGVESVGHAVLLAHAVLLGQAELYGDMLTTGTGHYDFWSALARRGARALREADLPTAPVWSEYDEWPRGRVLYDCNARRFIVRADPQLHQPAFLRLVATRFRIVEADALILPDDHYRSIRRLPLPAVQRGG
jgi:hypothetical protein